MWSRKNLLSFEIENKTKKENKLKKLGFVVFHHSDILKLSIPTPIYLKMVFISNGIFGRVVVPAE